ncbi:YT521-B-like splicing factor, putative [Metarhizium acridum CQMa 102]|uniref:YT521-B-like splicing factor, putative n=1 Tax=Metarhizium acridum (strain CQMa 102) TaxID=655827 RepID=E9E2W8_METAQ|nr:YT521-B-like splicing factor, putative [Metarhizium acridum CQMa 102]EFY89784.1 YT521-B-like splicing factor, putative [Metarhizium acridum CQMa 102]
MQSDSANRTQDAGQLDAPRQTPTSSSTNSNSNPNEASELSPAAVEQAQHQHPYQSVPLQQTLAQATMAYQQPQGHQEAFDLAPMNNTLLAINYRPQHSNQYLQGHSQPFSSTTSSPMAHQMTPMPQYAGAAIPMPSQAYYVQQQQIPQYYPPSHLSQIQHSIPVQGRQSMVYYQNQMLMSPAQTSFYYPHNGQYSGHPPAMPAMVPGLFVDGVSKSQSRSPPHQGNGNTVAGRPHNQDAPSATQNAVRGPPRKPRQSGHALWIGNLPPQTNLMSLVHHVYKVTPGMESLFLISKSNCAFANFKDEPTCSTAQENLHDSKFQSVRLVSRLRKSTIEGSKGSTVPTGPAVNPTPSKTQGGSDIESVNDDSETKTPSIEGEVVAKPALPVPRRDSKARQYEDKFFILKSLTTEDLDLSAADNVYLIFSANKSGEYFGYARMISEINEDPAAAIKFAPKVASTANVDLPIAIPTDATEYAPRGKIIDDSARGTIFWEAERDDSETESDMESESTSDNANGTKDETKAWGKPFKLEWLSTSRLPFFRTRGLRNPWNSNREVKIARDGTELEPSVGRRLIGLFNRVQNPTIAATPARAQMNFVPGYPMMRPY